MAPTSLLWSHIFLGCHLVPGHGCHQVLASVLTAQFEDGFERMWWLWEPAAFLILALGFYSLFGAIGCKVFLIALVLTSFWTEVLEEPRLGLDGGAASCDSAWGVSGKLSQSQQAVLVGVQPFLDSSVFEKLMSQG